MLPLMEDVEPPRAVLVPAPHIKPEIKSTDTQYLLNEFENVYDVVELAHGTLTPPQSPPGQLTTLEPLLSAPTVTYHVELENNPIYTVPEKQLLSSGFITLPVDNNMDIYTPVVTSQPTTDIDHELAVVDELVRSRVEDMQWSRGNSCSSSSPGSPGGSSSSNFGDCSSDDPEWVPDTVEHCDQISPKTSRKRSKPYSKAAPEEKKVRKKEQNKNAATRYRMKKKAEVEEILTEEKILLNKGTDLGNQITELQREIKYLKGLMRDLFKAKGLIN